MEVDLSARKICHLGGHLYKTKSAYCFFFAKTPSSLMSYLLGLTPPRDPR